MVRKQIIKKLQNRPYKPATCYKSNRKQIRRTHLSQKYDLAFKNLKNEADQLKVDKSSSTIQNVRSIFGPQNIGWETLI